MVERLNGIQKVRSSNLLSSTKVSPRSLDPRGRRSEDARATLGHSHIRKPRGKPKKSASSCGFSSPRPYPGSWPARPREKVWENPPGGRFGPKFLSVSPQVGFPTYLRTALFSRDFVKSGQTSQESCGERRESAFVHVSIPLTRSSGMDIRHRVRTTWRMQSALSVPLPGRRDSKADSVRSKERR